MSLCSYCVLCADMPDFACKYPSSRIVINIGALIPYDTSNCSRHPKLHFSAIMDGDGPILIELWPGELLCCDGLFWSQNLPGHNLINIGLLPSIFALKCSLGCLLLTVQSRREKNNGIHFSIVDNAEVHDGGHGCVVLFSHMVGSRQADLLMARRHGRTDSTRAHVGTVSAKTGYVAKICRQSRVSATCPRHVGDISN